MNFIEAELIEQAKRDGIQQLVVGAIVPCPGRPAATPEILVLDRAGDDFMGGIEELPSGKVEPGEPLIDALIRELMEETGLKPAEEVSYAFSFDYIGSSARKSRQFNFLVPIATVQVRIDPAEHTGFRWLDIDSLASSRLTANVVELLTEYSKRLASLTID